MPPQCGLGSSDAMIWYPSNYCVYTPPITYVFWKKLRSICACDIARKADSRTTFRPLRIFYDPNWIMHITSLPLIRPLPIVSYVLWNTPNQSFCLPPPLRRTAFPHHLHPVVPPTPDVPCPVVAVLSLSLRTSFYQTIYLSTGEPVAPVYLDK